MVYFKKIFLAKSSWLIQQEMYNSELCRKNGKIFFSGHSLIFYIFLDSESKPIYIQLGISVIFAIYSEISFLFSFMCMCVCVSVCVGELTITSVVSKTSYLKFFSDITFFMNSFLTPRILLLCCILFFRLPSSHMSHCFVIGCLSLPSTEISTGL